MKINIKNIAKLEEAIKKAEGKANARTVKASDIIDALNSIGKGISKKKMSGTMVYYTGAEHFPNNYKYRPLSTHWKAENVNGNWYITDIYRDTCPNRNSWNTEIIYSEAAKEAILEKAMYIQF